MCVYVCVLVLHFSIWVFYCLLKTYIHSNTLYIYMYICVYMYVYNVFVKIIIIIIKQKAKYCNANKIISIMTKYEFLKPFIYIYKITKLNKM